MATEKKIKLSTETVKTVKYETKSEVSKYLVLSKKQMDKFLSIQQINLKDIADQTYFRLADLDTDGTGNFFNYNVGFCYLKDNKLLSKLHKFLSSCVTKSKLPSDVAVSLDLIHSYTLKRSNNHLIVDMKTEKDSIFLLINIHKIPATAKLTLL